jgi:hypothetical protein
MNAPALGLFDYDCEGSYNDKEAWCTDREMILSDLTDAGLGGFADWLDSDRDGTWYPECEVPEEEQIVPEPEDSENCQEVCDNMNFYNFQACYNPCEPADYTCMSFWMGEPEPDCYEYLEDENLWCTEGPWIVKDMKATDLRAFAEWLDSDRDGTWYPECEVPEEEQIVPEPEEETNLEDSTAQCPIECG